MNLKLQNLIWIFVDKFSLIALSFGAFFAFALFLSPEEYGAALYVLAIVEIVGLFFSAIWTNPLIRAEKNILELYASVFWFGVLFVSLIIICLVTLFLVFTNNLLSVYLLSIASLKVLITIMARPFISDALRKRKFKSLAMRTITAKFIGASGAVFLAYKGFGSYAVIFQAVSIELLSLLILAFGNLSLIARRPKLNLLIEITREGFGIGLRELTNKGSSKFFIVCLGIFTSKETVGYFGFAMRLLELPYSALKNGLNSYAITVFKNINMPEKNLGKKFTDLTLLFTYFWVLSLVLMYTLSDIAIATFFPTKWNEAAKITQLLCIAYLLQSVTIFSSSCLASQRKSSEGLKGDTAATLIFGITCPLILNYWNFDAALASYLFYILIKSLILFLNTRKVAYFNLSPFLGTLGLYFSLAVLIIWSSLELWDNFLSEGPLMLLVLPALSFIVYFILTLLFSRKTKILIKDILN